MAFENGNARLIKEDKKAPSLTLKPREVNMLFALAIVGIAALVIYFILLPMFTNISVLEDDIDAMEAQRGEYVLQIAKTREFKDTYEKALSEYSEYSSYFYGPMIPEMIDERITSMMISHGMTPATLTMTTLEVEEVPHYKAEELRANPVPEIPEEGADIAENPKGGSSETGNPMDQGDAAEAAAGTAAENKGGGKSGSYVFVYTVEASAYGDRDELYTFLAQVGPMTAMEVTAFSFEDATKVKSTTAGEKDIVVPGTINMEIKLYVFVEGVTAAGQAGN